MPAQVPGLTSRWRGLVRVALVAATALATAGTSLLVWADPFGQGRKPGEPVRALLDSNQRYMFPQLVRSRQAEGVVLGTSSVKLLDPVRLKERTGLSFQNLAMNAATPWEQTQLFALIRREGRAPAVTIWGLDTTWCEPDATSLAKQRTPRPFPDWLYARASWRDWTHSFSLTALEIAARRVPELAGRPTARIRADGYDEFTPPDQNYDLARARFHLFAGGPAVVTAPKFADVAPVPVRPDLVRFPALGWLQAELTARATATSAVFVLPPIHAASLPPAGDDAACKASIRAVAKATGAAVMDYRFASDLAVRDENFWDPLHYRVGIAARLVDDITAVTAGRPVENGADRLALVDQSSIPRAPR